MRYQRTCGLDGEQLDELCARVEDLLEEPWDKPVGRPKALTLCDAVLVALMYERQNITEEVLADFFGVSQGTVSNAVVELTPLIADATAGFVPDEQAATEVVKGRKVLVDGALWPCWSWSDATDLWAGKYKTTGHGGLVITDEDGNIIYVSLPAPGCEHDMTKLNGEVEDILSVAGAVIADKGFQGSGLDPKGSVQSGDWLEWGMREIRDLAAVDLCR